MRLKRGKIIGQMLKADERIALLHTGFIRDVMGIGMRAQTVLQPRRQNKRLKGFIFGKGHGAVGELLGAQPVIITHHPVPRWVRSAERWGN